MKKGDLTKEFIKQVTDHLMIERTELYPADLGFVFGSRAFCNELADEAAGLYHQGYFPRLIVCGGPLNRQGIKESVYLKDQLIKRNVPADKILIEDQSTNTQENIEFAKDILDKEIGLGNIETVISIGQLYAARRYMMTLQRRWPEIFNMHASVNGFAAKRTEWPTHETFRKHVLSEWNKLQDYPKKDFIREIDIDDINRTVKSWRDADKSKGKDNGPNPQPV